MLLHKALSLHFQNPFDLEGLEGWTKIWDWVNDSPQRRRW